ncbi:MAG: hypothetical protein H6703_09130 [Myxococcales bacterium]|nr:hypothetical protein [Myxococcales bacterium]
MQPLEMQLGAVARQQGTLDDFTGLDVDFDAFRAVETSADAMRTAAEPLRQALAAFAARRGFDSRRALEARGRAALELAEKVEGYAAADAELQGRLDALAEPLAAARDALRALEAQVDAVVGARARHQAAHAALRERLDTFLAAAPGAVDDDFDFDALAARIEAFEAANRTQLAALDALGFAGLEDRLTAFEQARAAQILDFRGRTLDGLRTRVAAFEAIHERHRDALEAVDLAELRDNLGLLRTTRARQREELDALGLEQVQKRLATTEKTRAEQHEAVVALGPGELARRFEEALGRLVGKAKKR